MAKYIFPAVFTEEDEGFSINFPDVKNCFTSAPTITEAVDRAKDVLCLMLYDLEESNGEIPSRSDIKDIEVDSNSFVSLVSCDTLEYRKPYDNRAI